MRAEQILPRTAPGPGTPLWGEAPRRQPVVPLIAMAIITLLVCAPAAMSGGGGSSNPVTLMAQTAKATYEMAGLVDTSNATLAKIDTNTRPLGKLAANMEGIGASTAGMDAKTAKLSTQLGAVGASVTKARVQLQTVDRKLTATSNAMAAKEREVNGSLRNTRGLVREFGVMEGSIRGMKGDLRSVISLMAVSHPQTAAFAQNTTRLAVAGGNGRPYGVPNMMPGTRVMTVMLNMIGTMQKGGPLPARKDGAKASNILVGTLLDRQVPDGTNVVAIVQPFDGYYGLPGSEYFVSTPVNGF